MSSQDLAAVIEVMCGKHNAAALSAITGDVDSTTAAGQYWQQTGTRTSLGQVCCGILMKLIVDLWLQSGPQQSFPLVLRMLQQALHQDQASYRARAFDILYNLSLHACCLSAAGHTRPVSPRPLNGPPARYDDDSSQQSSPSRPTSPGVTPSPLSQFTPPGGGMGPLPSPRIHLPQTILQGSGSPRSSFVALSGSAPPQPSSPRSRLSYGHAMLGGVGVGAEDFGPPKGIGGNGGATHRLGGVGDAIEQQWGHMNGDGLKLQQEMMAWLRQLLFELLRMMAQVSCFGCRDVSGCKIAVMDDTKFYQPMVYR